MAVVWWLLQARRAPITGEWDLDADSLRRELSSVANDGIISSAAIIQGLVVAGASGKEAFVGVCALIVVGLLTTVGAQLGEATAERNSQLAIVASERHRLEMSPQEEHDELVELYEEKGLSPGLAAQVAEELMAHDALAAQLDAEFDLDEVAPASWPWQVAGKSALAFLAGSIGPLLLLVVLPGSLRGEITLIAVGVSLVISGWIGSRSEHASAWVTIGRTLTIGLVVLGVSTLAGSLVTF